MGRFLRIAHNTVPDLKRDYRPGLAWRGIGHPDPDGLLHGHILKMRLLTACDGRIVQVTQRPRTLRCLRKDLQAATASK